MQTIRLPGLVAFALLASSAALADEDGLYLGGSLGSSQQNFDASTFDVHNTDTGYKFALGFRPIKMFAAELSYVGFGRAEGGINYADTDAIGLFAVGFVPIPVVDLYGKVGVSDWRTDAHSPYLSFHRTGNDLAYGVGAGTHWGSLGARLEYERYDVSHASDMALASIGLTWVFL
jgi:hypothetical protein